MRVAANLLMIGLLAPCIVSCNRPATGGGSGASSASQLDSLDNHRAWIAATGKGLVAAVFPGASAIQPNNASMRVAEYVSSSQGVCAILADGDGKQAQIIIAADLRGFASDLSSWQLHEYVVAYGDGPTLKTQISQIQMTSGQINPCYLSSQLDAYLSRNGRAREKDAFLDVFNKAFGR